MAHDAKIRPMDAPHTDPDPSVTAAPTAQARDRISGYIQLGEKEGARLIVDGRGEDGEGYFLGPTIFDAVTPEMTIAKEEIFEPVLALERMDDLDKAIANLNASEFGNAAAIFTRDGGAARKFGRGAQVRARGAGRDDRREHLGAGTGGVLPVLGLARLVLRRPARHRPRRRG